MHRARSRPPLLRPVAAARHALVGIAAALALTSCTRAIEVEQDDEVIAGAESGVTSVECPSAKPWSATITTNDDGFSPSLVRVSRGHIVMFVPGRDDDNMVADDGSFRSGELRATGCLRFERAGSYAYHSEGDPDLRGVVEVHDEDVRAPTSEMGP